MAGINKVILVGNVGKDPDIRYTQGGVPVANFTLATSESYTDKTTGNRVDKTEWHHIICWRRLAEIAEQYVQKGKQLYIEGKLQTRDWTDEQGVKRYRTEIVADTFQLLGRKEEGQQSAAPAAQRPPARAAYDDYDIGDLGPPLDMDGPLSPGD